MYYANEIFLRNVDSVNWKKLQNKFFKNFENSSAHLTKNLTLTFLFLFLTIITFLFVLLYAFVGHRLRPEINPGSPVAESGVTTTRPPWLHEADSSSSFHIHITLHTWSFIFNSGCSLSYRPRTSFNSGWGGGQWNTLTKKKYQLYLSSMVGTFYNYNFFLLR